MRSKAIIAVLALAAMQALGAGAAEAQKYPTKPVRLIIPFGAGGTVSFVTNLLGQGLGEKWGQQVVIDPRPGGSGNIGADMVARSTPDGYTLLLTTQAISINVSILPTPVNPLLGLEPVGLVVTGELGLVVPQSLPVKTLQEFVAYAKANPGKLNYVSLGTGSQSLVAARLFNSIAGIDAEAIPYTGPAPATTDLISGRVSYWFTTVSNIQGGAMRALAVTGARRAPKFPDLPTFAEAGYGTFKAAVWYALFAPPGTPNSLVSQINADINEVLGSADVKQRFAGVSMDAGSGSPEQFRKFLQDEIDRWAKVVKGTGGTPK
jgi:tripartite-type tricarboxylate transporter receptor subunit TctC